MSQGDQPPNWQSLEAVLQEAPGIHLGEMEWELSAASGPHLVCHVSPLQTRATVQKLYIHYVKCCCLSAQNVKRVHPLTE